MKLQIGRILLHTKQGIYFIAGYGELVASKREYWKHKDPNLFSLFQAHHQLLKEAENKLEQLYAMPEGSLEGIHFIFGSIRDAREAMTDPELRRHIRNETISFIMDLVAEVRQVHVFVSDSIRNRCLFKQYYLTHNFYSAVSGEDPIVQSG